MVLDTLKSIGNKVGPAPGVHISLAYMAGAGFDPCSAAWVAVLLSLLVIKKMKKLDLRAGNPHDQSNCSFQLNVK